MLPVSRVIGHKEWAPGRKTDPLYDMNWRRGEVAAFTPGGDDMPTADDLFNAAIFTDNPGTPQERKIRLRDVLNELREVAQEHLAVLDSATHHGNDSDNTFGHAVSAHKYAKQAVDVLQQAPQPAAPSVSVSVDAAAVAAALRDDAEFLPALARAINDDADRRARDSDASTGPVS